MFNGLCHVGNWGSSGNMGTWGWIGMIVNLVFWIGLLVGLTLMVVRGMKRAQVPVPIGQPTAKEILQAQYARGEITHDEYEPRKQDIG